MAARYATESFVLQLASGASVTIHAGATRDSVTDAAVVTAGGALFSATAPVSGQGHVSARLFQYLNVYPRGEVS